MLINILNCFKKFYKYEHLVFYCTRYLLVSSVLICLYFMKDHDFYIVVVPYIMIITLFSLIRYLFPMAVSDMLHSVESKEYIAYIDYSEKQALKRGSLRNYYLYRVAQFKYYSGDFESCISFLKQIDILTFKSNKYGNFDELDFYFLAYLARIRLDNLEKLEHIKSHIQDFPTRTSRTKSKKMNYLEKMNFMKDVLLDKKTNDFYNNVEEGSKLEWIMKQYYSALNALNIDDKEAVFRYYQTIANEASFLFMVQEAKTWISKENDE